MFLPLILLFCSTLSYVQAFAQTTPLKVTIVVSGEAAKSVEFTSTDISAMKHTEVSAKDKDGIRHMYAGVPLADVLKQAGIFGGEFQRENLLKFVLVEATDGYQAVFSLSELDPLLTNKMILLADKADGKPLTKGNGPYRLVVPDEKKHTRWVREVASIQVQSAK